MPSPVAMKLGLFCDKCLRAATPKHGSPAALTRLAKGQVLR